MNMFESKKITAYHGGPVAIKKFDNKRSAGGVFWFSTNKDAILNGEVGVDLPKYIMEVVLTVSKTAGWDEYDKLVLDQIQQEGFDSIKLDDDWIIFDSKNIKVIKVEKIK